PDRRRRRHRGRRHPRGLSRLDLAWLSPRPVPHIVGPAAVTLLPSGVMVETVPPVLTDAMRAVRRDLRHRAGLRGDGPGRALSSTPRPGEAPSTLSRAAARTA